MGDQRLEITYHLGSGSIRLALGIFEDAKSEHDQDAADLIDTRVKPGVVGRGVQPEVVTEQQVVIELACRSERNR